MPCYPVAISFPLASKTQVAALAKQIPGPTSLILRGFHRVVASARRPSPAGKGCAVLSSRCGAFGGRPKRRRSRSSCEDRMANDGFMKPEVPDSFRDLMKVSIEQAK